ncbi:hypothetical protein Ddye_028188 [Dipteronia dyeriana]|uniref:Endonuclease/exonuclease/phosphatase domain-containing protein n=1 Tax=Dipteronia dyeriana TaxID=168575 RepID=A0AAD9TR14_9ROSI|nr:hypothetical protein Ddye_028188 [Dipteronia dyeriana]
MIEGEIANSDRLDRGRFLALVPKVGLLRKFVGATPESPNNEALNVNSGFNSSTAFDVFGGIETESEEKVEYGECGSPLRVVLVDSNQKVASPIIIDFKRITGDFNDINYIGFGQSLVDLSIPIEDDSEDSQDGSNEGDKVDTYVNLSSVNISYSRKTGGRKKKSSLKNHLMTTRSSKATDEKGRIKTVVWNLEEVTKMVENVRCGLESQLYPIMIEIWVGKEKRRHVRNIGYDHKPMILFIQESKLFSFDNGVICSLEGSLLTRGIGIEEVGYAGGLIIMWNEDIFSVKACVSNSRCIIVARELLRIMKEVVFCNVYAANVENERKELWDFILNPQASFPDPWCMGGDFNTVLDPSERKGGDCNTASMCNLNSFISETWLENKDLISEVRKRWSNCNPSRLKGLVLAARSFQSEDQEMAFDKYEGVVSKAH